MYQALEVLTLLLVAAAMAFELAHAAEFPGKLRLQRDTYVAVQAIYYPGFTIGGMAEPAAIIALFVLGALTPAGAPATPWILGALAAMAAMQAIYWVVTHPVNRVWLKDQRVEGAGAAFFAAGGGSVDHAADQWTLLRDRWEYSHVVRSGCAVLALILLAIALTTD